MKYLKLSKWIYCMATSTILAGMTIGSAIPISMSAKSSVNRDNAQTSNGQKIQTGKIIHDANIQVVSNLDDAVIKDVKIGNSSNLVIDNNGKQEWYAWGLNDSGQLGIGTTFNAIYPTKLDLSIFGDYISIDVSYNDGYNDSKSCYAIVTKKDKQELYVWGYNMNGQLGIGNTTNQLKPVLVDAKTLGYFDEIISVNRSYGNTYVVTKKNDNQMMYACGDNSSGRVGNGKVASALTFTKILDSVLNRYISIIKCEVNFNVISVYVVELIGLRVYVWGSNVFGQLGLGHKSMVTVPTMFMDSVIAPIIVSHREDLQIKFGTSSYMFFKAKNQLFVWGRNYHGQLGLNDNVDKYAPVMIASSTFNHQAIKKVQIDDSSFAIVEQNGVQTIYVWGSNAYGRLGIGSNDSQKMPQILNSVAFKSPNIVRDFQLPSAFTRTGLTHASSCAIVESDNDAKLYVWGSNEKGQFPNLPGASILTPTEVIVPANTKIDKASVSYSLQVIGNQNGIPTFYVAGDNVYGQLGMNNVNATSALTPVFTNINSNPIPHQRVHAVSAEEAYNDLNNPSMNSFKARLSKYVDISTLPYDADLSIVSPTIYNNANGYMDLMINTNKYHDMVMYRPMIRSKTYALRINGFRQIRDIPIITKKSPLMSANSFFSKAITNNEVNRNFIELYLDLSCIPPIAKITITPVPHENSDLIEFVITSNCFFKNNAALTYENYSQNIAFEMALGTSNPILIISLIIAGCGALLLILVCIHLSNNKYKHLINESETEN